MPEAPPPDWLVLLLQSGYGLERSMLRVLDILGFVGSVHGQPAWPFPWRFDGNVLLIDRGLARQVVLALAAYGTALFAIILAVTVRWLRIGAPVVAMLAVVLAPSVPWNLLFSEAHPTSLHRSPAAFAASDIAAAASNYRQQCAGCHGDDGRGEGPRAAQLPKWPPTLTRSLLWVRPPGELFWHVRNGMSGRDGATTMPAFGDELSDAEIWALFDFLRANAAGRQLAGEGAWIYPIAAPDLAFRCDGQPQRRLHDLRGQRVRLVFDDVVVDDPRVSTIRIGGSAAAAGSGCVLVEGDAGARQAYALVAGIEPAALAGAQFLVDRDGWLRARSLRGAPGWSSDDYLCRPAVSRLVVERKTGDGLGTLIALIDREPIRIGPGRYRH